MTHGEGPIACTLTAEERPGRVAELRAIGQRALLTADVAAGQAVLRFAPSAETRERLEAIVAGEARCCAFLSMTLTDSDDAVVLTITAPDGAEPVLAELVAAFLASRIVLAGLVGLYLHRCEGEDGC